MSRCERVNGTWICKDDLSKSILESMSIGFQVATFAFVLSFFIMLFSKSWKAPVTVADVITSSAIFISVFILVPLIALPIMLMVRNKNSNK